MSDVCLELGEAPLIKGKHEGEGTTLLRPEISSVFPSLGSHL